jgi:prepilin-type N-terminal cleavage/methylation domain-containing protein
MQLTKPMKKGFTLIEVLVSVSIFTIVMLIATGSVFTIVEANKKTHSLKSVMTNLNFALESIARDMRVGTKYTCDNVGDCQNGGTILRYKANRDVDGDGFYSPTDSNDQIEYSLGTSQYQGQILKRIYSNGQPAFPITAQEINITNLKFYASGTNQGGISDGKQPKVVITIQGYAGIENTRSNFNIETLVGQRSIDS